VAAVRPARHVPQLDDPVPGVQARPGFPVSALYELFAGRGGVVGDVFNARTRH